MSGHSHSTFCEPNSPVIYNNNNNNNIESYKCCNKDPDWTLETFLDFFFSLFHLIFSFYYYCINQGSMKNALI